jgi:hypothetical protein
MALALPSHSHHAARSTGTWRFLVPHRQHTRQAVCGHAGAGGRVTVDRYGSLTKEADGIYELFQLTSDPRKPLHGPIIRLRYPHSHREVAC